MIERAYVLAERVGLPLWGEDEAGPYQTIPHPGSSWQSEEMPACQDHQYIRGKTCKLLTLFRPVLPLSVVDNSVFSPNRLTLPIDPAYPSW